MEPRDAIFAAEKATTLQLLMKGEATARTETRDIFEQYDDHESELLGDVIREELARRADEHAAAGTVADTAEAGADTPTG
jgi:hypothetical protein